MRKRHTPPESVTITIAFDRPSECAKESLTSPERQKLRQKRKQKGKVTSRPGPKSHSPDSQVLGVTESILTAIAAFLYATLIVLCLSRFLGLPDEFLSVLLGTLMGILSEKISRLAH
jgi:hypothetical protein